MGEQTSKRRQQIMDAAIKVFAKKGFNGTTTREIAREAGIAEGTIFRYFKTKKDLLLSLVSPYVVQSLADTLEEVCGEDDETVLKAILRNRLKIINKNIDLVRLLLAESQFHPELRELFVAKIVMEAAGLLERYIAQKIEDGEYKDIEPAIAVRALAGMTGIFVLWREYLAGEKYIAFEDEKVVDAIADIYLNGIRKRSGGGSVQG
ncbi:TetR/AcrR family transcriptional regulator [Phosphitispora fastidiosa]|uniref:TetR/AcrR family transcriptional regulator n=1 Tax=Phosphitispora fastidiosa TaxID=2837202 RepID=UPI001E39F00A|nr:TetR/AcrR family transcriptional regulator [Phosphitispora fastidiosa]MBU7005390.1 AcrR family transcriptional regulator [Phosphitispora fastidiosa]